LPIPQKFYNVTKRLKTKEEVEKYFPRLSGFYRLYRTIHTIQEQQRTRRKENYTIQARKRNTPWSRICIHQIRRGC
jgi:hypothetical protein